MDKLNLQLYPRDIKNEEKLNSFKTYTEKYNFIINYYKNYHQQLNCYCENHHIEPKCLGGTNNKENLVKLPANIHYIVHFILPFVMQEQNNEIGYEKMLYAFILFQHKNHLSNLDIISSSNEYLTIRTEFSKLCSKRLLIRFNDINERQKLSNRMKKRFENLEERKKCARKGEKNGMFGKRGDKSPASKRIWIKNEITKESKYIEKTKPIPDGFVIGRINPYRRTKKYWITNGKINKLIKIEEPIPDGWKLGKNNQVKPVLNKIWITNGKNTKYINKNDKIPNGWYKGRSNLKKEYLGSGNPAFNRKWIYNPETKERKYVKKEELDFYLQNGFILKFVRNK